ncbi:MAG: hypothetical protein QXZ36_07355 [Thermoproteota archaeon]
MARLYTYKITLSNTTSTATPPNLQVRLNINFASLVSNINADLGNIRFSSDQAGNNLLYAWLESAPQGTFTQSSSLSSYISSNVWVNLGNNIIPANGSLTIYMQVLSSGIDFDGVYWGANPLWTNTYGQYDNGAKVFNNYWNFAGTSLPSGLNEYVAAGSVSINNGIIIKGGTSASGGENGIATSSSFSANTIFDFYGTIAISSPGSGWAWNEIGFTNYLGSNDGAPNLGGTYTLINFGPGNSNSPSTNQGGTVVGATLPSPSGNVYPASIWTQIYTSTTYYTYQNYTTNTGYITGATNSASLPFGILVGNNLGTYVPGGETIYWLRTRAYPPNGTDPVLTSITLLLVGNYYSASIPTPEWTTLSGKPYVIVSAKGISNGLSNIPNDGADFGPDTLLGASSPNQYGPPYTQTSGIQEAINYAFANDKKVKLLTGIFKISPNISYKLVHSDFIWPHGTTSIATSVYSLIVLPNSPNTTTTPFLHSIEGSGGQAPYGEVTTTFNILEYASGLTIIDASELNLPVPAPYGTDVQSAVYVMGLDGITNSSTYLALNISDIFFYLPPVGSGQGLGGVWAMGCLGSTAERLTFITSSITYGCPSMSTTAKNIPTAGLAIDGFGGDGNWTNNIYAQNLPYGFIVGDHTTAGTLQTEGCWTGIAIISGHTATIQRLDMQQNVINIALIGSSMRGHIGVLDGEDAGGTTTLYDVDVGQASLGYGGVWNDYLIIDELNMEASGATINPRMPKLSTNVPLTYAGVFVLFRRVNSPGGGFAITTPAFPASGTAVSNNNPFMVRIYLLTVGGATAVSITDSISGTTQSLGAPVAGQQYVLYPGSSITFTWSSTSPTWLWYAEV